MKIDHRARSPRIAVELQERSSAPTVRDLRAAAKGLFKTTEAEPDSTPPNDGLPQEEA